MTEACAIARGSAVSSPQREPWVRAERDGKPAKRAEERSPRRKPWEKVRAESQPAKRA